MKITIFRPSSLATPCGYHRFCLSFREVEELLAARRVVVSYEAMRQWGLKFGPEFTKQPRRRHGAR